VSVLRSGATSRSDLFSFDSSSDTNCRAGVLLSTARLSAHNGDTTANVIFLHQLARVNAFFLELSLLQHPHCLQVGQDVCKQSRQQLPQAAGTQCCC